MLVERPIIDQFAERWPELKDSRDIVEWTYDVSQNSGSPLEHGLCVVLFTRTLQSLVI
ncbi:hypothetical protein CFP56_032058 [Quercus suber]|uniref:Uncharacterized protein n=1 Tax=Quercus suber TaxID=58331 RepID=A0AAW0JIN2_QUESU